MDNFWIYVYDYQLLSHPHKLSRNGRAKAKPTRGTGTSTVPNEFCAMRLLIRIWNIGKDGPHFEEH